MAARPYAIDRFVAVDITIFEKGGSAMSNTKSGYIGRIKNGGTQVVKAPNQVKDQKKGVVKTGNDLRTGKK